MTTKTTAVYAQLNHLRTLYGRTVALALVMLLGALLPQANVLSPLIPYLLVIMLFFSFLDITINRHSINKGVVGILLANIGVAFAAYVLLKPFDTDLALVAIMTGITPTAIAAPVIVSFLKGRVEYVIASVLLTNVVIAVLIPFLLPIVVGKGVEVSTVAVLQSVFFVVFVPLLLSRGFAYLPPKAQMLIRSGKSYSFTIWLFNLFIVSAKSASFIMEDVSLSAIILFKIALVSLVICIVNFGLGALCGGRDYKREASQSLGQKNNSFTIWLSLAFISPLVALGPTFYVIYHNLYNSFQLYLFEKERLRKDP
jgi:BASS family bile acid:Na+ symporter